MAKKPIKVPSIPGPKKQLCYAPEPLLQGMKRCLRVKGHTDMHDWEMLHRIKELEKQLAVYVDGKDKCE